MQEKPIERNLALELVRVTENAAMAAGRWMGRGDKIAADQAAVDAMRSTMQTVDMDGIVVIGEGEKDEAPMLYIGEQIGNGSPPLVDIAVDPLEGTTLLSKGLPNALSVVALTERGRMNCPREIFYMDKIAVGPEARGSIDITASPGQNLRWVAKAKRCAVADLTVIILDRPRHQGIMEEIRASGARIKLITDGDVAGGIATALPDSGVDVLLGIGGTTEAVLTAAALKCLGGELQCRPWPRDEPERLHAIESGIDLAKVYTIEDMIGDGDTFFAATGVTNGEMLKGVQYFGGGGVSTQSLVMRSYSGTVRWITAQHNLEQMPKLQETPTLERAGRYG
ncbi:MAG TPA: class II fructose-bisphosphatase [Steroidobacteraceae bacterium]|nr:class II fructose-bisphosphatase [Steroidobacteraceae bacterium]